MYRNSWNIPTIFRMHRKFLKRYKILKVYQEFLNAARAQEWTENFKVSLKFLKCTNWCGVTFWKPVQRKSDPNKILKKLFLKHEHKLFGPKNIKWKFIRCFVRKFIILTLSSYENSLVGLIKKPEKRFSIKLFFILLFHIDRSIFLYYVQCLWMGSLPFDLYFSVHSFRFLWPAW